MNELEAAKEEEEEILFGKGTFGQQREIILLNEKTMDDMNMIKPVHRSASAASKWPGWASWARVNHLAKVTQTFGSLTCLFWNWALHN